MTINEQIKNIKLLSSLTKKQRNAYMDANGFNFHTKYGYENAFIKYAIDNNDFNALKIWFNEATYTGPNYFEKIELLNGEIIEKPTCISNYANNRFYEFFNAKEMKLKK